MEQPIFGAKDLDSMFLKCRITRARTPLEVAYNGFVAFVKILRYAIRGYFSDTKNNLRILSNQYSSKNPRESKTISCNQVF